MPKTHRSKTAKPSPEKTDAEKTAEVLSAQVDAEAGNASEPDGPLYPSEQDPEPPIGDNDPVMRWEFLELKQRVELLEIALQSAQEDGNGGVPASAPDT